MKRTQNQDTSLHRQNKLYTSLFRHTEYFNNLPLQGVSTERK